MRFLRLARVPALRLGLFFFFLLPLGASEITFSPADTKISLSGENGTLHVKDGKAALYSRNSLSFTPSPRFFIDFELSLFSSDLSMLNGSLRSLKNKFGLDLSTLGFSFSSGFFGHGPAGAAAKNFRLTNEGGEGVFFDFAPFLRLGPLTLTPSFSRGKGFWESGDLYVSLGKPELPSLCVLGLSADLKLGKLGQELSFRRVTADIDLMTNLREPLFDLNFDAYLYSYRFSLEKARTRFSGSLGWLYTRLSLEGALTAANQHVVYFPYLFYDVSGLLEAHSIFGAFGFSIRSGIFRGDFGIGAFHFLSGPGEVDTRYQYKNWPYGGGEGKEKKSLVLSGLGAAYLTLGGTLTPLPFGLNGKGISFGLKKTFFLPWGHDGIFSFGGNSAGVDSADGRFGRFFAAGGSSLLKTILFSGLSFTVSLDL